MEVKNCIYVLIQPFISQQFSATFFDKNSNYTTVRLSNITKDLFALAQENGIRDIIIAGPHIADSYAKHFAEQAINYAHTNYAEGTYHITFEAKGE